MTVQTNGKVFDFFLKLVKMAVGVMFKQKNAIKKHGIMRYN